MAGGKVEGAPGQPGGQGGDIGFRGSGGAGLLPFELFPPAEGGEGAVPGGLPGQLGVKELAVKSNPVAALATGGAAAELELRAERKRNPQRGPIAAQVDRAAQSRQRHLRLRRTLGGVRVAADDAGHLATHRQLGDGVRLGRLGQAEEQGGAVMQHADQAAGVEPPTVGAAPGFPGQRSREVEADFVRRPVRGRQLGLEQGKGAPLGRVDRFHNEVAGRLVCQPPRQPRGGFRVRENHRQPVDSISLQFVRPRFRVGGMPAPGGQGQPPVGAEPLEQQTVEDVARVLDAPGNPARVPQSHQNAMPCRLAG